MAQASLASTKKVTRLVPTHVNIPKVNIDANVVTVGTKNGQIDMPLNPKEVGWYNHATHPILVGHSGWYDKRKVAFDGLRNVKTGDVILVEFEGGMTRMYRVDSVLILPWNSTLADILTGDQDLQLITCTGNWNRGKQIYEQRLIVNATEVTI